MCKKNSRAVKFTNHAIEWALKNINNNLGYLNDQRLFQYHDKKATERLILTDLFNNVLLIAPFIDLIENPVQHLLIKELHFKVDLLILGETDEKTLIAELRGSKCEEKNICYA